MPEAVVIKSVPMWRGALRARLDRWLSKFKLSPIAEPMRPLAVWACVGLGALLGIAILEWPYARECGWWLMWYLGAVGMVVVAGIWAAWHAWDSRIGIAHVVALIIVFWGCSLTAREVLPRVGYAKSSAGWLCVSSRR
jgi:hypothetical protein